MATLPGLHYNVDTIARGYYTYQSVWVPVHDKLPCQGNTLTLKIYSQLWMMKSELITGPLYKKTKTNSHSLLGVSTMKWGHFSVDLLDTRFTSNALSLFNLSAKNFRRKIFLWADNWLWNSRKFLPREISCAKFLSTYCIGCAASVEPLHWTVTLFHSLPFR